MKSKLSLLLASLLLVFSVGFVFADDDVDDDSMETRDRVRDEVEQRVSDRLEAAEAKRMEVRDRIEVQREERSQTLEQKREQFQERLQLIKDERKKAATEKLNTRLSTVKDKWVDHWNNVLTRLEGVLVKIEERDDANDVTSEIATARTAIAAAQTSINELSAKTYEIEITDEEGLGDDVSSAVATLKDDLTEVGTDMKAAHDAVTTVISALK